MRLLLISCLLFVASMAQTDPDEECNVLSFQGGFCDDPVGVDLVFVLDADLSASETQFQSLRNFALGLLNTNFNTPTLKSSFSFGLVLIDNDDGTVVRMEITSISDFNLQILNTLNTLQQPSSALTDPNGSMAKGIEQGLDMLDARPDVNQAKILVVLVDAETMATSDYPDPCTGFDDINTRLSALTGAMFVKVGIPARFPDEGTACYPSVTTQFLKPAGYDQLTDTSEEDVWFCGTPDGAEYFGDYRKTAVVDQSGTDYFSFEKADDPTRTLAWDPAGRWLFSGGAEMYYISSDAPIPAYEAFWRIGSFHTYLSKCYFPPTSSPTAVPTLEPTTTLSPTNEPSKTPTLAPTKEPSKTPTLAPSKEPTKTPTKEPTDEPSMTPTKGLTNAPTLGPSVAPTLSPTNAPTVETSDNVVTQLSFERGYTLLLDNTDCSPSSNWLGTSTLSECASQCRSMGYNNFVHVTHGNQNCKCADDGCATNTGLQNLVAYYSIDTISGNCVVSTYGTFMKCTFDTRFGNGISLPGGTSPESCAEHYADTETSIGWISYRDGKCLYNEDCSDPYQTAAGDTLPWSLHTYDCTGTISPTMEPTNEGCNVRELCRNCKCKPSTFTSSPNSLVSSDYLRCAQSFGSHFGDEGFFSMRDGICVFDSTCGEEERVTDTVNDWVLYQYFGGCTATPTLVPTTSPTMSPVKSPTVSPTLQFITARHRITGLYDPDEITSLTDDFINAIASYLSIDTSDVASISIDTSSPFQVEITWTLTGTTQTAQMIQSPTFSGNFTSHLNQIPAISSVINGIEIGNACTVRLIKTFSKCSADATYNSPGVLTNEDPQSCANQFLSLTNDGYFSFRQGHCIYDSNCPEYQRINNTEFEWEIYYYNENCTASDSPTLHPTLNPLVPTRMPTLNPLLPTGMPTFMPTLDPFVHISGENCTIVRVCDWCKCDADTKFEQGQRDDGSLARCAGEYFRGDGTTGFFSYRDNKCVFSPTCPEPYHNTTYQWQLYFFSGTCLVPTDPPSQGPTRNPTSIPTLPPTLVPSLQPTLAPTIDLQGCGLSLIGTDLKCDVGTRYNDAVGTAGGHTPESCAMFYAESEGLTGYISYRDGKCLYSTDCPIPYETAQGSLLPWSLYTYACPARPSLHPTKEPSGFPTLLPTKAPSLEPIPSPSDIPTLIPTQHPTYDIQGCTLTLVGNDMKCDVQTRYNNGIGQAGGHTPESCVVYYAQNDGLAGFISYRDGKCLYSQFCPTPYATAAGSELPWSLYTYDCPGEPTINPTLRPTDEPTVKPTRMPTNTPTLLPSLNPTRAPSDLPTWDLGECRLMNVGVHLKCDANTRHINGDFGTPETCVARYDAYNSSEGFISYRDGKCVYSRFCPEPYPTAIGEDLPWQLYNYSCPGDPSFSPSFAPTFLPTDVPTVNPSDRPTNNPTVNPTDRPTINPTYDLQQCTLTTVGVGIKCDSQVNYNNADGGHNAPESCALYYGYARDDTKRSAYFSMRDGKCVYDEFCPVVAAPRWTVYFYNCPGRPTHEPSIAPTDRPSSNPTINPTNRPTMKPTLVPSDLPTIQPTLEPTFVCDYIYATWTDETSPINGGYYWDAPANRFRHLDTDDVGIIYCPGNALFGSYWLWTSQLSDDCSGNADGIQRGSANQGVFESVTPQHVTLGWQDDVNAEIICSTSLRPTLNPTDTPTDNPSLRPSRSPTAIPTTLPTAEPTVSPTKNPTLHCPYIHAMFGNHAEDCDGRYRWAYDCTPFTDCTSCECSRDMVTRYDGYTLLECQQEALSRNHTYFQWRSQYNRCFIADADDFAACVTFRQDSSQTTHAVYRVHDPCTEQGYYEHIDQPDMYAVYCDRLSAWTFVGNWSKPCEDICAISGIGINAHDTILTDLNPNPWRSRGLDGETNFDAEAFVSCEEGHPSDAPSLHPTFYPTSYPSHQPSEGQCNYLSIQFADDRNGAGTGHYAWNAHDKYFESMADNGIDISYCDSHWSGALNGAWVFTSDWQNPCTATMHAIIQGEGIHPTIAEAGFIQLQTRNYEPDSNPTVRCLDFPPPTVNPSVEPTNTPSTNPTMNPSNTPTVNPSDRPTLTPTPQPTYICPWLYSSFPTQPDADGIFRWHPDLGYFADKDGAEMYVIYCEALQSWGWVPDVNEPCDALAFGGSGRNAHNTLIESTPYFTQVGTLIRIDEDAVVLCMPWPPTMDPTEDPTHDPTADPTVDPTYDPTANPTVDPTEDPTNDPTRDPTADPTVDPTFDPTADPTTDPSIDPTVDPTHDPTADPTVDPTYDPTADPTSDPSVDPTMDPTFDPTADPTINPTSDPTVDPTNDPTIDPTIDPTFDPTADPTIDPSIDPTVDPTNDPTADPTVDPTYDPTADPTSDPSVDPTMDPTFDPTADPTINPTNDPSVDPTNDPTIDPTIDPTFDPTADPTTDPSIDPTVDPTHDPTADPTVDPTYDPTADPTSDPSVDPTLDPTFDPTADPTADPSRDPSVHPTNDPSVDPTVDPTYDPTADPTSDPSQDPSVDPTFEPTVDPTVDPTKDPTADPTVDPSEDPTFDPTYDPTADPTGIPTQDPTMIPTVDPSPDPTVDPTYDPTIDPSGIPTRDPTESPTSDPSADPTMDPTYDPTADPTVDPSHDPTPGPVREPTPDPITAPTVDPTLRPSNQPSLTPSDRPTNNPTTTPTRQPTRNPSFAPTEPCTVTVIRETAKCNVDVKFEDPDSVKSFEPRTCALLLAQREGIDSSGVGFFSMRENVCIYAEDDCPWQSRVATALDWNIFRFSGNCAQGEPSHAPTGTPTFVPTTTPTTTPSKQPSVSPIEGCLFEQQCSNCKCTQTTSWNDPDALGLSSPTTPEDCLTQYSLLHGRGFFSYRDGRCVYREFCPEEGRPTGLGNNWVLYQFGGQCVDSPTQDPVTTTLSPTGNPTLLPSLRPTKTPSVEPTSNPTNVPTSSPTSPTFSPSNHPTRGCTLSEVGTFMKCTVNTRYNDGISVAGGTTPETCAEFYQENEALLGWISYRDGKCIFDADCPDPYQTAAGETLPWSLWTYVCPGSNCVDVNHNDIPGVYTCDCVVPSDPCFADGGCEEEPNCPAMDGQASTSCQTTELCSECKCNSGINFGQAEGTRTVEECVEAFSTEEGSSGFFSIRDGKCVYASTCSESERVATDFNWVSYAYSCGGLSSPTQDPTSAVSTAGCPSWCTSNIEEWEEKCDWGACSGCNECSVVQGTTREWTDVLINQQLTCSGTVIAQSTFWTTEGDCKALCDSADNCNYIFLVPGVQCDLFETCASQRSTSQFGNVYEAVNTPAGSGSAPALDQVETQWVKLTSDIDTCADDERLYTDWTSANVDQCQQACEQHPSGNCNAIFFTHDDRIRNHCIMYASCDTLNLQPHPQLYQGDTYRKVPV